MENESTTCQIERKDIQVGVTATPEDVGRVFSDPKNYLDVRRYIIDVRRQAVQEFIGNRKVHRILDIGCGDGSISVPLLNQENRLTLLDLSKPMLARAMSKVSPELQENVATINEDFLSASLEPGAYDLVMCIGVLAHVPSPDAVIRKAVSLLRPGGLLVLECTDAKNFTNQITFAVGRTRKLLKRTKGYRTRLNSAEDVVRMVKEQELNLLSVYRYNVALPLMGKVFSQATLRRIILWIYGTPKKSRNAWLGKECLFLYEKGQA